MDINEKIAAFDPNGMGDANGTIYGLPFDTDTANLVILPVPWEVTVSYQAGTASAPEAIREASYQVDLFDPFVKDAWKLGLAMKDIDLDLAAKSDTLRQKAEHYINQLAAGSSIEKNPDLGVILAEVNQACSEMNAWVKKQSLELLNQQKLVGLLGGDHSTPLGLMQALAAKYPAFGILHIDAHADLRKAYEDFEFWHEYIMYNALKIEQVTQLV